MHPLIVIPARFGSVRLPGKPLCEIGGEPLVRIVVRNILEFNLDAHVVLATDDVRVENAVTELGVQSVVTSQKHRSGTERVAEVTQRPEFAKFELIVNIQGDQPYLPREAAVGALAQIAAGFPIGTAAVPLQAQQESNRNRVKVAVNGEGLALSFSREMPTAPTYGNTPDIFLHLGIYAYTREALINWVSLPPTAAESDENLEQLRPFLNGTPIGVALLDEPVESGVDTLDDLKHAQLSTASNGTNE